MKKFLPNIINNDQTSFLKNRFIGENIRLIESIINHTNMEQIPGLLLFVDFEKAFDSIEWSFIEKTLRHFNFGTSLVSWERHLSTDSSKHHLNKSIAFSPLICLGLIDNISDLLLHHLFLIAKRYIYTCKLNNCNPALQVYIQTVMNSMEIEKEIASNNNNMSSFKNKWSPLKLCPSDK